MRETQSPQEYFKTILLTVVGQAYDAAGYRLEEKPMQWSGGRFRFRKTLENNLYAFIEYQLLAYVDTEWSSGVPSRFRVTLIRSDDPNGARGTHADYVSRDLSALVVTDFDVPILPSNAHWWTYSTIDELGKALAESGHLVVGYGMPWLAGELLPGEDSPSAD
ncbi:MAG: hypothetical protein OHK0046_30520 [Anaerolineae bacterium]